MKYEVKVHPDMGRGLFATELVGVGEVLMSCEILLLSEQDTKTVNATGLQYYTFKVTDAQDCLVLGLGEIFNHGPDANVIYNLEEVNGRLMMVFMAVRTVKPGAQFFINYAADSAVNVENYLTNKSLVG